MNLSDSSFALSEQQQKILQIFFSTATTRTFAAYASNQRFVYYTSADTAVSILRNKEVWMRKTSMMNDYREVEHGFDLLSTSYKANNERMRSLFDSLFPDFCRELERLFNGWLPHFRTDTYITCVSEHDTSEDTHGRLSMWRGYGGAASVALVFNGGPFLRPSNALKAHSSPVAYLNDEGFERQFVRLIDSVESNLDFIRSLGSEAVKSNLFAAFRYAMLCTKHPGFHEEREWRIIYTPSFERSERLSPTIESIGGTPQSICKIPLKDIPDEGLTGLTPSELVDRVIIGPSKYPVGIFDALMALLTEAGVQNPATKIVVSDLPLRQ